MKKDYSHVCDGCKNKVVITIYMGTEKCSVVIGEADGCSIGKKPQNCREYEVLRT